MSSDVVADQIVVARLWKSLPLEPTFCHLATDGDVCGMSVSPTRFA